METLIKLTNHDRKTRNGVTWPDGATRRATGKRGQGLCSSEYLHAYRTPLQAAYMAPYYGYQDGVVLSVLGNVQADDGTKVGCRQQTVLGETDSLPTMTIEQRVAVAILISPHPSTRDWAIAWLSGADRSRTAAWVAEAAAAAAGAAEAGVAEAWAAAAAARVTAADRAVPLIQTIDSVLSAPDGPWDHLYRR